MKSSKPFAFVLWSDDERLPLYLSEQVKVRPYFDYLHYIRHDAEKEPAPVIKNATKQESKPHWHCVLHFRKATDYEQIVRLLVTLWASDHPEFGECPFTFARTHEGKVNNLSTWLAYVVHEPNYMAYIESKCDKPESHKMQYDWNDIRSTDYDLLNTQVVNALAYIDKCDKAMRSFVDAKEMGMEAESLTKALGHCETYHQMLVVGSIFKARQWDGVNMQ